MKIQTFLTNERIRYKFGNRFDLANYAIRLAQEGIRHDQQVTLSEIMEELVKMPDEVEREVNN